VAGALKKNKQQSSAVGQQNQMSAEQEARAAEDFGLNKKSYEGLVKQYNSLVQPGADFNLSTLQEKMGATLPEQAYTGYANDPFMQDAAAKVWQSGEYAPNYMEAAGRVSDIYKQGMNPMQQNAINAMYNQGVNGSPAYQAGMGEYSDVLSGKYLGPESNPYLRDTYKKAASELEQQAASGFGRVLNYFDNGGESWKSNSQLQEALGKSGAGYQNAMEDLATNIYGGNYNAERNRMTQMTGMAPTFQNMGNQNISGMMQAGNLQTQIPLQMAQGWMGNEQQNELWNRQGGQAQMQSRAAMLGDMNAANQVSFQNAMNQYQQPFNLGSWYTNMSNANMGAMPQYTNVGTSNPGRVTDPGAYQNHMGNIFNGVQMGAGIGQQIGNMFPSGGGAGAGYAGNPYLTMPSSIGNGAITSPSGFSFG
jgi:hypothetical protein